MHRTAESIAQLLLRLAAEDDTYEEVLSSLGRSIRECAVRAERNEELADYECEKTEVLLGMAFLACQAKITAVTEAVARVRRWSQNDTASRATLRALGPQQNGYSRVQLLWALGNYFKHRDEWTKEDWETPRPKNRATITTISAFGLDRFGESGNLRRGAEALGNTEFSDMSVFQQIVEEWTKLIPR